MGEKETIKEKTVNSAGIELHTENSEIFLWAKDASELNEVVNIYLKNFVKKIGEK